MKKKLSMFLGITLCFTTLCACNNNTEDISSSEISSSDVSSSDVISSEDNLKKAFESAEHLGTLAKNKSIARFNIPISKDVTKYYRVSFSEGVTFNMDEYDALNVVAYDNYESYEYYSYSYECHIYDENFTEINIVQLNTYEEFSFPEHKTYCQGCYLVNKNLPAGDYYFSVMPNEEPENSMISLWVSLDIGD